GEVGDDYYPRDRTRGNVAEGDLLIVSGKQPPRHCSIGIQHWISTSRKDCHGYAGYAAAVCPGRDCTSLTSEASGRDYGSHHRCLPSDQESAHTARDGGQCHEPVGISQRLLLESRAFGCRT